MSWILRTEETAAVAAEMVGSVCVCTHDFVYIYTKFRYYRKSGNFRFSDSMESAKIKRTKIMRIINDNAVRGRLSENYLTR